jgi:hypothetical protein
MRIMVSEQESVDFRTDKDVIIRQDPNGLSEVLFNPIASLPNAFRDNCRVGDHTPEILNHWP